MANQIPSRGLPTRLVSGYHVFEAKDPAEIAGVFPSFKQATVQGQDLCAVPATLDHSRVLTNMGYHVQSPIRQEYKWSGSKVPRWYQVATAEFFSLHPRSYCHSKPRCVDKDTEYLSETGWKKVTDYAEGEKIAQWNRDTAKAEFVVPTEYLTFPCSEFIHLCPEKGVDQMLTKDHRIIHHRSHSMELRETTAGSILEHAEAGRGWHGRFPVVFKAPDREGINLSNAEIRVMVATIADGHFPANNSTTKCAVRVKKQAKKYRMRQLLQAAGIYYKEREQNTPTAKGFTIFAFYAPIEQKVFEGDWWDCTPEQLQVVVEEVGYWDSCFRKAGAIDFSTTQKASADFIQYAASACGRAATLNTSRRTRRGADEIEYVVHICKDGTPKGIGLRAHRRDSVKVVPSEDGKCYCFSVPSTWMIMRRNGRVFVTGNTGKTLSALWAADYLMQKGLITRVLVIAPLSTLTDVWENEMFFEFPHRSCAVLHGSRELRHKKLDIPTDFYITNHDGPKVMEEALLKRPDIDCIIIDEVAVFRSAMTSRWKVLKKICNDRPYIWGLTGTPTPNLPTDAYGQMKLITPENYPHSFTRFKDLTMQKVSTWNWLPRKGCETIIAATLRPSIQFGREVCTDMEPCIIDRKAELSVEQRDNYKKMKQDAVLDLEGKQVTAVNSAVLAGKVAQIACGLVYGENGEVIKFDYGPRLEILKELIAENDEKVIVLVPFTGVLDMIKTELSKDWSVAVVDGRVTKNKRDQIFRAFRSSKDPHIILAHPQTMAHGLDLTAATLTIWYAPYNKNEIYEQANARMDGSKQKIKIDIARIYATAEEKALYASLEGKTKFQDVILDLLKKPL